MTSARGKLPGDDKPPLERLLTVREVAAATNVTEKTVWTWIKHGKLLAIPLGRLLRIRIEDYQAFLKEQEMKSVNSKLHRKPK